VSCDDGLCIRARIDVHVVTLNRTDEGFGHSIALRTSDWRRSRFEADVASELACLASNVTAAIVGQPLDGDRHPIDQPEAMLDSRCRPPRLRA
jgi:hypothetical protein